ncbi:MAG: hypothetical protein HYR51_10300 [Candidatus Rokubacteria bacterium]|nr:hypothetical protein [Candidatus Rokubacteria bacterium]
MTVRTAAVIALAIILAVALAELSCVADEMVSPAGQDLFGAGDAMPASVSDLPDVGVVGTPVMTP